METDAHRSRQPKLSRSGARQHIDCCDLYKRLPPQGGGIALALVGLAGLLDFLSSTLVQRDHAMREIKAAVLGLGAMVAAIQLLRLSVNCNWREVESLRPQQRARRAARGGAAWAVKAAAVLAADGARSCGRHLAGGRSTAAHMVPLCAPHSRVPGEPPEWPGLLFNCAGRGEPPARIRMRGARVRKAHHSPMPDRRSTGASRALLDACEHLLGRLSAHLPWSIAPILAANRRLGPRGRHCALHLAPDSPPRSAPSGVRCRSDHLHGDGARTFPHSGRLQPRREPPRVEQGRCRRHLAA